MPWVRPLTVAVCCAYPLVNHAAATLGEPRYAAVGIALAAGAFALGWLVVVFFVVEYIYRRVPYRHHPHVSPWQMVMRLGSYELLPRSAGEASRLP